MSSSIPNPLVSFALARPNHPAYVHDGKSINARELAHRVRHMAELIAPDATRAALLGKPDREWITKLLALWWNGICVAPLNHRASSAEISMQLAELSPDFVIDENWQQQSDYISHRSVSLTVDEHFCPLEQDMLCLFTSGSTGEPKQITLTMQQLLFSAMGSTIRLGHSLDDCWLNCLPENHIASMSILFRCLLNQITMEHLPVFEETLVADRLNSGEITMVSLVPAMLDRIIQRQSDGFHPNLRVVLLGGATCSEDLIAECRKRQIPIALSWGMTESASQVCTRLPGDFAPTVEGFPMSPFARVSTENGRFKIDGPIVDRPLLSSDLGDIKEDYRVFVSGRIDDLLIRGGENISPYEIEDVVQKHPAVDEAVVVASDHQVLGQVPVVYFTLKKDKSAGHDELSDWCKEHLSHHKIPDQFIKIDSFPKTSIGKINKSKLVEESEVHCVS